MKIPSNFKICPRRASWMAWIVLMLLGHPVTPAVIVVDGDCTLVDAIEAANTNAQVGSCAPGSPGTDTVELATDVLLLESHSQDDGTPPIVENLTLEGRGHSISRDPLSSDFRLLNIRPGVRFRGRDVTLAGGYAPVGGSIRNSGDTVLTRVLLLDHEARESGGAIFSRVGSLTLVDSTISGSQALVGAAIWSAGDLLVRGSSLIGNDEGGVAGAVYLRSYYAQTHAEIVDSTIADNGSFGVVVDAVAGDITIRNSTISGNGFEGISGRYTLKVSSSTISGNGGVGLLSVDGAFEVEGSSIVGNAAGGMQAFFEGEIAVFNSVLAGAGSNCVGGIVDGGGNFAEDDTCGPGFGELTGLDPVLARNGGATLTHALAPNSSAVDAAGDCGLAVDQRRFSRDDGLCDSGAFEVGGQPRMPTLVASGSCPGELSLSFSGGSPDEVIGLLISDQLGAGRISAGPCAGVETGLTAPEIEASIRLDALGESEVTRNVPLSVCGRFVQMVDGPSCALSEAIQLPSP